MIPQELKDSSSWVIWKEETRDGKPTKVPYNPRTGKKAAPNNPSTWGTYDEAQSAVKAYGVNGLGFVFSESDAFTGIDLDKCRDSETGEMEPWVKEIISQLNSYTEISPSGTGVHILIKGQLPYGSRRKGKIEMYDTGRYFTMTGHHLEGTPLSIEERQAEIEAFHQEVFRKIQEPQPTRPRPTAPLNLINLSDNELISKAQRAADGEKFAKLMRGDWSDYPSQSEADLALCAILAFWTQERTQIDRLFRESGLMRDKWDKRHSGEGRTYGDMTIKRATANTTQFCANKEPQTQSLNMFQQNYKYLPVTRTEKEKVQHIEKFQELLRPGSSVKGYLLKPVSHSLALLSNIEAEAHLQFLKKRFKLRSDDVIALRQDSKSERKKRLKNEAEIRESLTYESSDSGGTLQGDSDSQELKRQASTLLKSPNILDEVVKTLQYLGQAGQEREIKILYLVHTSRVLEAPVSVAIKGHSSGGKSFLVKNILKLFPESAYYAFTAMSEKALIYTPQEYSHRHIILYEAEGMSEGFMAYAIRSLLSEGRIDYEVTIENPDGSRTTQRIEKAGPTGLVTTTTRVNLHPENETRILTLEIDDSNKQTQTILEAIATRENYKAINLSPFIALQKLIEINHHSVVVPPQLGKTIAQGCNARAGLRIRRDFSLVFSLMKAHALLYAHNRERDNDGQILANIDDYIAVHSLIAPIISYGTGQAVPDKIIEVVEVAERLTRENRGHKEINAKMVGDRIGVHKNTARTRINKAIEGGFLINDEWRENHPYRLRLGDPLPEGNGGVLPDPQIIKNKLSGTPPATAATTQPQDEIQVNIDSYRLQPLCNRSATAVDVPHQVKGVSSEDWRKPVDLRSIRI